MDSIIILSRKQGNQVKKLEDNNQEEEVCCNTSSEEIPVPTPTKSTGVRINELGNFILKRSRYSDPRRKTHQSSEEEKGKIPQKPSKKSEKAKKKNSV